ncbi:MAG: hypothetical protein QXI39_07645 [Candidatus Bathyarchaeia archaeon]
MMPYEVIVALPGFKPCGYVVEGIMAFAWEVEVEVLKPALQSLA